MDAQGNVYVLELNPLPGLTPDWSDLVLIAKAINMDYRTLIAEILAGGLKRLREKKRAPVQARNGKTAETKSSASSPALETALKPPEPKESLPKTGNPTENAEPDTTKPRAKAGSRRRNATP